MPGHPAVRLLVPALAAAALAVAPSVAIASTVVTRVGGETLTHAGRRTSVVRVIKERAATGGRSVMLSGAVAVAGSATLPAAADHVAVRVRAKRCGGAPVLRVQVDGKLVVHRRIAFSRYRTLTVKRALAAGQHRLAVALAKPASHHGCRRRLYVDGLSFTTTAKVGAPGTTGSGTTGGGSTGTDGAPATGTAPTTGTTAPGGSGDSGGLLPVGGLLWAPPLLIAPTTITVPDGDQWYDLDNSKDYIIKLPAYAHNGSLGLQGGHNVVLQGGHIRLPLTSSRDAALELRSNTGTVHVEGLWIDGSTGYNADAIRISSPSAIVQLENVRASGLRGTTSGSHTDVVQPYGGVRDLRIDHLSADSNYQGIFAKPDLGPIGQMELHDVDLTYDDVGAGDGGYMVWLTNGCSAPVTTLTNVYVKPSASKTLGRSVWPNIYDSTCPAQLSGNTVSWPSLPVAGHVTGGTPPGGSYVTPAGVGTAAYASPGYLPGA